MRLLFALSAILVSLLACAEDKTAVPYQAGIHYQVIANPVRTLDPSKIEVTEVFWYGCGHCYHFAPLLAAWEQEQPADVLVRHSPAIWEDVMATHARLYYTAKALGKLDEMHLAIFDAMHKGGKRLAAEDEIAKLFANYGVDEETFHNTFNSFGVRSQVKQADARQRSYGVASTPTLVVNGRYRISGLNLEGQAEMLKVADFLINKIRQEK